LLRRYASRNDDKKLSYTKEYLTPKTWVSINIVNDAGLLRRYASRNDDKKLSYTKEYLTPKTWVSINIVNDAGLLRRYASRNDDKKIVSYKGISHCDNKDIIFT
jgi:hypothetical protein